jgi:hypothetical protein
MKKTLTVAALLPMLMLAAPAAHADTHNMFWGVGALNRSGTVCRSDDQIRVSLQMFAREYPFARAHHKLATAWIREGKTAVDSEVRRLGAPRACAAIAELLARN